MLFDFVFLVSTVRRIHQYYIELVIIGVVQHVFGQGIVVHHTWRVYVMKKHVSHA